MRTKRRPQLHRRAGFSLVEFTLGLFILLLLIAIIITAALATARALNAEKEDPYLLPGRHVYRLLHDALLYADQITLTPRYLSEFSEVGQAGLDYAEYACYDVSDGYLSLDGQQVFEPQTYEGARITARAECFPGDVPYVRLEVELNLDDGNHTQVFFQEGYVYLEYCPAVEDLRRVGDNDLRLLYFHYTE